MTYLSITAINLTNSKSNLIIYVATITIPDLKQHISTPILSSTVFLFADFVVTIFAIEFIHPFEKLIVTYHSVIHLVMLFVENIILFVTSLPIFMNLTIKLTSQVILCIPLCLQLTVPVKT